jgi:hypothetical protein
MILFFLLLLRDFSTFLIKSFEAFPADAGRITTQLGIPRGRYDEHSSRFSLSKTPRFIESSRKKPNFRR